MNSRKELSSGAFYKNLQHCKRQQCGQKCIYGNEPREMLANFFFSSLFCFLSFFFLFILDFGVLYNIWDFVSHASEESMTSLSGVMSLKTV